MTNKNLTKKDTPPTHSTESYWLEGKCGQVLDIIYKRSDAIYMYLIAVSRGADGIKLIYLRNGIRYRVIPNGTLADYK